MTIRLVAVGFGILGWLVVSLFAVVFPAADSLGPGLAGLAPAAPGLVWLFPLGAGVSWLAWLLKPKDLAGQGIGMCLFASLVLQLGLAMGAGLTIHRDFFSLPFQLILLHYALFLEFAPHFRSRIFFQFAERFYSFTLGIIIFVLVWVAMMGWAIAGRTEPRWIPSIAYNIILIGLCCFLYLANLNLRHKSKREVLVSPEGIFLDGLNIVSLFTPTVVPLANWYFSQQRRDGLTCQNAQVLMGRPICEGSCEKISQCAGHRYAYNRVNELKRICAALRIGTITTGLEGDDLDSNGWFFQADPSISIKNRTRHNQ